jgi:hypothetical protein
MVIKKNSEDVTAQNRTAFVWSDNAGSARFTGFYSRTTANNIVMRNKRLDADTPTDLVANVGFFEVWGIIEHEHDYANADGFIHQDGAVVASNTNYLTAGNTSNTIPAGATCLGGFQTVAGPNPTTTNDMDMDVAEWVVFNSVLSTDNRQRIEGYLAWKWGLEGNLPIGHPYKDAPPTT